MSDIVLIIDPDPDSRQAVVRALPDYRVREADGEVAALALAREGMGLAVVAAELADGTSGVIQRLRELDPQLPIVLLAQAGRDSGADTIELGTSDCIDKPIDSDRLRSSVRGLLDRRQVRAVRQAAGDVGRFTVIARSSSMRRAVALTKRVARANSTTVLLEGEAGTGKELMARAIHERSGRAGHSFVVVSCGASPESMLEGELFGYEKGVQATDQRGRAGAFESADGGTVFLDEVGDLPPSLQARVLRVLQERRVRRVGASADVEVDVRVVASSSRELRDDVASGRFRQDLYWRLRVVPLRVPPLRERVEDILPLAEHLLRRVAIQLGRPELRLTQSVRENLRAYAWPGNVRELSNAIERSAVSSEGPDLSTEHLCLDERLPPPKSDPARPVPMVPEGALIVPPGERNLERVEAMIIRAALAEASGHKSHAADALGINRTTLYNKLRELNLMPPRQDGDSSDSFSVKTP